MLPIFVDSLGFAASSSLHCAGMCGPMAAVFGGGRTAAASYHAARAGGYAVAGALIGHAGAMAGTSAFAGDGATVSFVLAACLVLFALGVDKHLGRVPGVGGAVAAVVRRSRGLPPSGRAALLGAVTPLLPCGLLWAGYASAAVSGGAGPGAAAMLGFAIGSGPLLALAQVQLGWLRGRLGPAGLQWLSRGVMLVAAAVLVWRGIAASAGANCCA